MFCTSCGVKNALDSNFCKQCGGKLAKPLPKISEDAFDRALPDDEQTAALLERAYRLRRAGDRDAAIALCEESLRLREDSTSAHSLLGQLHEEKGDTVGAIREYERVLALNPGSIADRVKLDELKAREADDSEDKMRSSRPHPRVRLGDHRSAPAFDAGRFMSAGVAVALMALGGLVALQLRPHVAATSPPPIAPASTVSTASNAANTFPVGSAANPAASALPPASGVQTSVQTAPSAMAAELAANAAALARSPGKNFAPTLPGPTAANSAQTASVLPASPTAPTIIYKSSPAEVRYIPVPTPTAPLNVAGASTLSRLPGKNGRGGRTAPAASDPNRVMLDPDVVESGGKITVHVGDNDMPGRTGDASGRTGERPAAQPRGNRSDASVPGESEHIELEKPHVGSARSVAVPSSVEARSLVAVGEDKKIRKDYRGAIEAFTRALGSAGDQSGYIYQQRALCYQYLTDTSSARADYSHAIDEYRKLEARDPETAHNGIRACQSGIKTCGE